MTPANGFLPYGRQSVDEEDIAAVANILRGDWLTTGPMVAEFEEAFAARVGAHHAVACNSGTAGLHLAAMAMALKPGDWAVVPSITFLATANAIRYVGAEVAFADVDPATGLMTADTLQAALDRVGAERVKLILPVHLKGIPADMAGIAEIATARGIAVVEDAAHALGSTYQAKGQTCSVGACAQSAMAVFSLHPVKTITAGEAGMVTTNDPQLHRALRRLRSHGMEHDPDSWVDRDGGFEEGQPAPWYYEMTEPGYNYRLPDFACALGLSQLGKLDRFLARRAALVARYDRLLAGLAPLVRVPERRPGTVPGWHLYAIRIDFADVGIRRGTLMRRLRDFGIGTQVHYKPVHTQPYYRQRYGELVLPGAQAYYEGTLSLPLFPDMADDDVDRVVDALSRCVFTE